MTEFEDNIKQKLIIRGFTKEQLLNNRGIIGATIDETILVVVKNFALTAVSQRSEPFNGKVTLNFGEWTKREGYLKVNHSHYKKGNDLISVEDLISKYWKEENDSLNCG